MINCCSRLKRFRTHRPRSSISPEESLHTARDAIPGLGVHNYITSFLRTSFFEQETKLNEEVQALEQEIARLENNPDKKIKAVVSGSVVGFDEFHGSSATSLVWKYFLHLRRCD